MTKISIVLLLLTFSLLGYSEKTPPEGYFEKVNALLKKQIEENNRLLGEGREEEMNFVVDAYPLFAENTERLLKDVRKDKYKFLNDYDENLINDRLLAFYNSNPVDQIKPYLVLIPAYPLKIIEKDNLLDNVEEADLLSSNYRVNTETDKGFVSILTLSGQIQITTDDKIAVTPVTFFDPNSTLLDFLIDQKGYKENEKLKLIDDANKEITKRIPGIQNRETLVSHLVDDYLEYLSSDKQLIVTVNEEESRKKLKSSLAHNVQEWQSQLKAFIKPNKGLTVKSYQDYQVSSFERGEHEYILNGDLLPEDAEYKKSDFIDAFNDQLHFLAEHSGAQLYVFPIRLDYLLLDETLEIDNIQEDGPPTLSVNPKDYLQSKLQEVIDAEGDNIALVLLPYTNIEDGKIVVENGHLNLRDYSKLYPSLLYTENDDYFENIDTYFSGELSNATEYQELVLGAFKGIKKPMITYAYGLNGRLELSKSIFGVNKEKVSGFTNMRKVIFMKSTQLSSLATAIYFNESLKEEDALNYDLKLSSIAKALLKEEKFVLSTDLPYGMEDGLSDPFVDQDVDSYIRKCIDVIPDLQKITNYQLLHGAEIQPLQLHSKITFPSNFSEDASIPKHHLRNPKSFEHKFGNSLVDITSFTASAVSVATGVPADAFVDYLAMGYYLQTGQYSNLAYSSVAFATPYVTTPMVKLAKISSSSSKVFAKELGQEYDDWLLKQLPEGVTLPQGNKLVALEKTGSDLTALYTKPKKGDFLSYTKKRIRLGFDQSDLNKLLTHGLSPEEIKELALAEGVVLALAILDLGDKELEDIDTKSCKISRRLNWRIMELDTKEKQEQVIDDICSDEELKKVMEGDTSLVSGWEIAYINEDELRKDKDFISILWQDCKDDGTPLPAINEGDIRPAEKSDIRREMKNNSDIYVFYKSFYDYQYLKPGMRNRYIETLGLSDNNERIKVLNKVFENRKAIVNYLTSKGFTKKHISKGNTAYGHFKVIGFDNGEVLESKFVSISGYRPEPLLVDENYEHNGYLLDGTIFIPVNTEYQRVPNKLKGEINPNMDRYFLAKAGQHFDSEAKVVEYICEQIRKMKGLTLKENEKRADLIEKNKLFRGLTIKFHIVSEMHPCESCHNIIDEYNKKCPTVMTYEYGTEFHNLKRD